MIQLEDLSRIPTLSWGELQRACQQSRHAWRTPVLANVTDQGARLRTVVLRKSDSSRRAIRFYTDCRSAKWPAVEAGDLFTVLFYDPKRKWQLSAKGTAEVPSQKVMDDIWRSLPVHSRAAYASQPQPGKPLPTAGDGLPPDFFDLALAETEYARSNFAVFELILRSFEVLQLHRDGHRRAAFTWNETTASWDGQWLVP